MKLTYFQLEDHIAKKKIAPLYIVSGEEVFLKQDSLRIIRKAAIQTGFSQRIRFTPETGFADDALYNQLYASSLIPEKRLIEIYYRDGFPNKASGNLLAEYVKNPSPNNVLMIEMGKVDAKVVKNTWYPVLEKSAICIAIWPILRDQLPQWIINRSKKYKMTFTLDAANLLADYVEGNLIAAAGMLEKIFLLQPTSAIDVALIDSVVNDESYYTIFDLIENVINGNRTRLIHILDALKTEGLEPAIILWGLTRELRLLADCAEQLRQGQSHEQLFKKHRIFPRRQSSIRRFLAKFSPEDCWQQLSHATEIDCMIKGAKPGNVFDALQLFCLRMV